MKNTLLILSLLLFVNIHINASKASSPDIVWSKSVKYQPCEAEIGFFIDSTSNVIQFISMSWGNPTSWYWDFGDGGTSTLEFPTHEYVYNGSYSVTLTISNSYCSDSETETIVFTAIPCNAEFNYTITGNQVNFQDISFGFPTSWYWDFADGTTSILQNPSHMFTTNSNYNVSLFVSNANCNDIETEIINCVDTICNAEFSYNISSNLISFQDLSLGNPTSWLWDFGDGNSSPLQNPVHYYAQSDSFNVTLTIYGNNCYDIEDEMIEHEAVPCEVSFLYTQDSNSVEVFFEGSSPMDNVDWFWDFGDGTTSTWQYEIHTYSQSGTYEVTVIISNAYCSDTATMIVVVLPTNCEALFSYDFVTLSDPRFIAFTDLSQSNTNTVSWHWDFGDDDTSLVQNPIHKYLTHGTYYTCLVIADSSCIDTFCTEVFVPMCINIEEINKNDITIYPNPSFGEFIIEVDNISSIEIEDIAGKQIEYSITDMKSKYIINLKTKEKGIFFVKIYANNNIIVKKVIILPD